ncbi:MAG: pseudouridine synthase [bacterium]
MRRVLHPSHSQFTLGNPGDEGVDSFTAFRPLDASVVEARPRTGRTHQIRVHLAAIGHPIAGDTLYGPAWTPGDPDRTLLHAFSLAFDHDGRRHRVEAPPPSDLRSGMTPAAAAP